MRKKHFLFAALFLAALVFGFSACENPNGDLLNNGNDNTGITDNDSTTNNPDQGGDNNGGNSERPVPDISSTLVATGAATDVEYSSVTLWGRINTDTLWAFPNVKWGIECSTSKETIRSHSGNKTLCTTDLVGENADEFSVELTEVGYGKMLYYNAYLLINDIKYVYGEVDSVHMDVKLTLKPNNSDYGTVTGSGYYDVGAEVTITATLKENYYFTGWSDCDSKELSRTITLTSDSTITANFSLNPRLTVQANNSNYGTVTGSGLYEKGTEATITATPKANYYFTSWSDGVADNPRTVVVNSDTTFTANFTKKPYLTVKTNNSNYGTVSGSSGYYMPGEEVTITATPNSGAYFVEWNDGNTDNPRTVVVNSDTTFTANFAKKPYLTVAANYGMVTGSGYYMPGEEVTITATPNSGAYFVEWNDGNTDNPRTVTINGDITYTATFAGNPNGTANGYEYVDLGLPSGTKWATCNVGATTPEGYGNYYAWGETEPKTTYDWSTYKWCNGSYDTQTKYCTSSRYGTVDNKTVLELADDAARTNWGGAWRMPTDDEWTELRTKCTWTWTTLNGKNGYEVKGANGNSIFLPAAGFRYNDDLNYAGRNGGYWSSSLRTDNPYYAWGVYFDSDDVYREGDGRRCFGLSVRPVLFGE